MENNQIKVLELVLLVFIFILISLISSKIISIYHTSDFSVHSSLNSSFSSNTIIPFISSSVNPVSYEQSISQGLVAENEYNFIGAIASDYNSNFVYNEKFYPGNISGTSCSVINEIKAPHMCWSLFTLFSCGGGPVDGNSSNLVGYLGFPLSDTKFPNNGAINYSNLYSAISNGSQNEYQLPSSEFKYSNFINWSSSTIKEYPSDPYLLYAINTSFDGYHTINLGIPESTLIIPAISCGSTFVNNYITYPGIMSNMQDISTLSGFVPSVYLASADNENGLGIDYALGNILSSSSLPWTGSFNSLLAYQVQSIDPAFNYNMPTEDYAQFPKGNKGDEQYINTTNVFLTPLNMSYYGSSNNSLVSIYVSNTAISSIVSTSQSKQVCSRYGSHGICEGYTTENFKKVSADTFTDPDLEAAYYPDFGNGMYLTFSTDGIFPICAWNTSIHNALSSCTFENQSTVNGISYQRLWLSNYLKKNQLYNSGFTPGYDPSSSQNQFTLTALDSFCFYGESFGSTGAAVYTPPSYTRVIPPLASENYTSAIGTCNAFFNNTNCFSSSGEYLNFADGIFSSNIACTSTGIHAENVTDAWISSVFVANNAGDYCGEFKGQKNPSNPLADSTMFLQNISNNCPQFNSNSSSVNLVITVKNVGNTEIKDPYLVALYGNNNPSTIFPNNNKNSQHETYDIYQGFLNSMKTTTGVIEVEYNNNFDTNMYVFNKGNPLNPIPIQYLFSGNSDYEAGPFNNSLLGMFMYDPVTGLPNNVIRTSNTVLSHSSSSDSQIPVINPNGTATFTIQVPMSLFEALLSGKYQVSVFFGDSFNVTWDGESSPSSSLSIGDTVNPLVSSSTTNPSQIHNNELISTSGAPSPIWQYLVSYNFNMSNSPFKRIGVYSDNLSVSVSAVNSTTNTLNVTANPSVSVLNGSGSYKLSLSQLKGSSISCFVSPDNVQDFGVFWSKQVVSPSNLEYALSNSIYSGEANQASNTLITGWTGILFMPYSDQVALNYNNLPVYYPSTTSFQIEKPTLNKTAGQFSYEVFDYLGKGYKPNLFSNLSGLYSSLNSTVLARPVNLPNASLASNIIANSLVSDPSIIRIFGENTLVNYSNFENKSFNYSITNNSKLICSGHAYTSDNSTYSIDSNCVTSASVNNSYINISSKIGPFFVDMYNNSNLNLSNETADGTVFMAGNETLSKSNKAGLFYITIPINAYVGNGVSLVFSPVPLTKQLYNSDIYLYNINGTPFDCNIVNNFNNTGNLDVSRNSSGMYYAPNGTMMCNVSSDFTYLRAVFVNNSNGEYLGSGDIQSGLAISNISINSSDELNISINGVPVNAQNAQIFSGKYSSCNTNSSETIYNGIMKYPAGCDNLSYSLITFDYNDNGTVLPESAVISPKNYFRHSPELMYLSPSVATSDSILEYNLTIPNTGISRSPIEFSLQNDFGGCNDIILTSQNPYPYAEVPYQVVSSDSQSCYYTFVGSSGNKYSAFETNSPSISYNNDWLDYNSSQYNVQFSYSGFGGDILSNCQSGFGPCIDSFSANGKILGNLLFNNVSTSSATISQSLYGPVEDCFTVSYTSSQTVNVPESGFGGINYNNNQIYQTITPSQTINSEYCLFDGSDVITDFITASGSPIDFKVQNQMISNFSYVEDSNHSVFYVPPAIDVGYSSYSNVNLSVLGPSYYNLTGVDLFSKCISYNFTGTNISGLLNNSQIKAINISSSDVLKSEKLYCIENGTPSYTPQLSLSALNNSNKSTGIGFAYQPGNYSEDGGTLYDACTIKPGLSISSNPIFYVNGVSQPYDGSNSENSVMENSANYSGEMEMLYSPSANVSIYKCAPNSEILSYSTCTAPVQNIPKNGSYNNLEALPTGGEVGGGCFIGNLNSIQYNCAPTDGFLDYKVPYKTSSSSNVSISTVLLNQSSAPTTALSVSFDCSISSSNSSKVLSNSCSYPNNPNSGTCSASFSYKSINSTAYNLTAMCSVLSDSTFKVTKVLFDNISNLAITGSQSEKTGLLSSSSYLCGNETNTINENVINGWSWSPYSTAGSINPAPSTNPSGVAEIGGCEAGRDIFIAEKPNITLKEYNNDTFQDFYSCASGYTGTITACSQKSSLLSSKSISNSSNTCYSTNVTLINSSLSTKSVNGTNNGGLANSCNAFSAPGYISPTVQDDCIAYHLSVINSTFSNYELQYANSSDYGVGMGVIGGSYHLNVSIPNSKKQNSVKDAYLTSLSESQIEGGNDILTDLLPYSSLESNLPGKALSISALYSFDMLNILMLQDPSFGVSGIPGFVNGSMLDYALSIFTGGTSGNCAPPYNGSGDAIFTLGEGELCSGKTLPSSYKEGVFLSLGTLNEGLHSIQFYSIGNSTEEAEPSVNVFDSVGNAVDLNSACSNGNSRVFTSTYTGGKWSFNITSDQQCNPINNKLYGYIVNCIYQTPGNQTYTIASQYYLAYNLPTVWNISYSLLVSPKSYETVPTPVYQINYSTGSILTLQQPNKTVFIEKGLPTGYKWDMVYDKVNRSSTSDEVYFYSIDTHSFKVQTLSNHSAITNCYTTYSPTPSSGSATSGTTTYIQFAANTTCYSYFSETGLPTDLNWNVTYNNIIGSSSKPKPLKANSAGAAISVNNKEIEFITNNSGSYGGNFSYYISDVKTTSAACTEVFEPKPDSGYLLAGTNQSIVFTKVSDTCVTTFKESGLPLNKKWYVKYNGSNKTATINTITFSTGPGNFQYSVSSLSNSSNGCTESYIPNATSGSLKAGSSLSIKFSTSESCITTFTEKNLSSGDSWSVTFAGTTESSTSSTITFTTGSGSDSWSATASSISTSTGCAISYNSLSGSANYGSSVSVSFSGSTACTTTFYPGNLPSSSTWSISYDGVSGSASGNDPITLTTGPGSFNASPSEDYDCSTGGQYVTAGTSATFSSWSCTTNFYVWTGSPEPFSETSSVTFNGNSKSDLWNPKVKLPNGDDGEEFTFNTGSSSSTESWSTTNPINGIFGDCRYGTGYDQWSVATNYGYSSSGNTYPGESVYIYYYSPSCQG